MPLIKNYTTKDYPGELENWSAQFDNRGILYFTNAVGLLAFDGRNWTLINNIHRSCRTLAISRDNHLYVGGNNYFGYVESDAIGNQKIHDMTNIIPEKFRLFGEVWKLACIGDKLIVTTTNYVFIIKNQTVKVIESKVGFQTGILYNNQFFIKENGAGIKRLEGDELKLIPDGKGFTNDKLSAILPFEGNKMLFVMRGKGLFIYDGQHFTLWDIPVNRYFIENNLYCGIDIECAYYALGTIKNGFVIIDRKGIPLQYITKEKGLNSNTILGFAYSAHDKMLWATMENGVASIEIGSPFYYYWLNPDISTIVNNICVFDKKIIFGGNPNTYSFDLKDYYDPFKSLTISKVNTSSTFTHRFVEVNGVLYNLAQSGTSLFDKAMNSHPFFRDNIPIFDLIKSPGNNNSYIVCTTVGLFSAKNMGNKIVAKRKIFDISLNELFAVKPYGNNYLWYVHGSIVKKIKLNEFGDSILEIKDYTKDKGIPYTQGNSIEIFKNQAIIYNDHGFFYYSDINDAFEPCIKINNLVEDKLKKASGITALATFKNNDMIFLFENNCGGILKLDKNNNFKLYDKVFNKLSIFNDRMGIICPIKNDLVAYNLASKGIIFYDPTVSNISDRKFKVLLEQVKLIGNDSIIFKGTFTDLNTLQKFSAKDKKRTINYGENSIKFNFSAIWFENAEEVKFRYKLDGFDKMWSAWSKEDQKDYTNLPEGDYVFHVVAQNLYEEKSNEVLFRFTILPLWYRTWWCFLLYAALFLTILLLIIRLYTSRLKKTNIKLEKLVNERREVLIQKQDVLLITELKNKELEKRRLLDELQFKSNELKFKNNELRSFAIYVSQKNNLINFFKDKLAQLNWDQKEEGSKNAHLILEELNQMLKKDNVYIDFQEYVEKVNADFFKELIENSPGLTKFELRLAALIKLKLSTKEIALIENKSVKAIETSRYRLRTRLKIGTSESLPEFLNTL